MLSDFEKQLLDLYNSRMIKSKTNIFYSAELSNEEIAKHCVKLELEHQLKQMRQNMCNHCYTSKYKFSRYNGTKIEFTCMLCKHKHLFSV